jgi:hypothetical protein
MGDVVLSVTLARVAQFVAKQFDVALSRVGT